MFLDHFKLALPMSMNNLLYSLIMFVACWSSAHGKTIEVQPSGDWFAVLSGNGLEPGDEVVMRAGVYTDSRRLVIQHIGTAARPIVIRSARGERAVLSRPDAKQNTINVEGSQHLKLIGLEITGGSSAIRIGPREGQDASDIAIEGLHIHDIGGVAITCNHDGANYRSMAFRRNHIHHTSGHGEAFYLGGNNASAIFCESIIENNYIHDLRGPDVSQGDGVEIKQGSWGNRVVGNVIHDTNYPGITVYGTGGQAMNLIEGNLIWNTGDHGIQAAADAVIRGNFVANAAGAGIYSREHQGAVPSNLRIEGNHIFAARNAAIRIVGGPRSIGPIELIGNQLHAKNGHPAIRIDNQLTVSSAHNSGQGSVIGLDASSHSWQAKDLVDATLPELSDHPAWEHLERSQVQLGFSGN